mmetsp:Transcript_51289/g.125937  ORF Transcript_51289/g.125937 Transcript_51289/m.125937 type:complete len:225 (-) Transcript_51289:369-1043(-)
MALRASPPCTWRACLAKLSRRENPCPQSSQQKSRAAGRFLLPPSTSSSGGESAGVRIETQLDEVEVLGAACLGRFCTTSCLLSTDAGLTKALLLGGFCATSIPFTNDNVMAILDGQCLPNRTTPHGAVALLITRPATLTDTRTSCRSMRSRAGYSALSSASRSCDQWPRRGPSGSSAWWTRAEKRCWAEQAQRRSRRRQVVQARSISNWLRSLVGHRWPGSGAA